MNKRQLKRVILKGLREQGFKDYLTTAEEIELVKVNCLFTSLDGVINSFSVKKNLTAYESRCLKTAATMINKALISITGRQDLQSMERIRNKSINTSLFVVDKIQHDMLKKETTDLVRAGEKLRDRYYDLCCETMAINCDGCIRAHRKCGLYKEFTKNMVAEPSGEHFKGKRCKYAFQTKKD